MISCDNGFEEALGLVLDAGETARRLCDALGYRIVHQAETCEGACALLGLAPDRAGREVLLRHPDAGRGGIRLVDMRGDVPVLGRDGAQAWDHGGIFDINVRALADLDDLHARFTCSGFLAPAPVTSWDFGTLGVREVVERDADGICIAAMERVHPPLQGYETIGGSASWVFNSTQIVPDFEAARSLFVDALGWLPVQETEGFASGEDGANCMGFPPGIAPSIPMRIGIFHPRGKMEGSVEIIAFDCGSRDFSASPQPTRGWAGLRFCVSDLAQMAQQMCAGGCEAGPVVDFDWEPYGAVRGQALTTPWGARFELLQPI